MEKVPLTNTNHEKEGWLYLKLIVAGMLEKTGRHFITMEGSVLWGEMLLNIYIHLLTSFKCRKKN